MPACAGMTVGRGVWSGVRGAARPGPSRHPGAGPQARPPEMHTRAEKRKTGPKARFPRKPESARLQFVVKLLALRLLTFRNVIFVPSDRVSSVAPPPMDCWFATSFATSPGV